MSAWRACALGLAALLLAGCATSARLSACPAGFTEPGTAEIGSIEPNATEPSAAAAPTDGVDTVTLSVEEALMLALENNEDLRVRRYEPQVTGAFEHIERGVFDPVLFAEFLYERERTEEISRSTQDRFDVDARATEARAGVRKRFATGTDVEVALEHDSAQSNRTPDQQNATLGLTITQSLIRGRRPAVNLARVRQAEYATAASRYQLRGFVETLLADTKIAYWRLVLAQEEINIFESSLELSQRQLAEIEQSIEVGAIPATEAAAARTEVAIREQALIDARSELKAAQIRLLRLVNPGGGVSMLADVATTSRPETEATAIEDVEERVRLALVARSDLNEARMLREDRRLETIVTRDGLLPRLDFFVRMGGSGYSDQLLGSLGRLGDDTYDLQVGIRYEQTLRNRSAKGRHLAAWARRRQAMEAIENLEQIIRLDVLLAANEVDRTRQQIAATTATRTLQETTVEVERERFAVGSSTALLVAQAQRDLLAAQIAEIEAVVDYRIALVRLYLAEGSMIERHGLEMPR